MGSVVSIHIADAARGATRSVPEAHAVRGKGLEGDRYFHHAGTFSATPGRGREVTLIEMEALEALKRDYNVELDPAKARRNIVTRGVALNHLVGKNFQVGKVTLVGIHLCEPCSHLEELTLDGVVKGLVHRGGLRAEVVTEGVVRVGDPVHE